MSAQCVAPIGTQTFTTTFQGAAYQANVDAVFGSNVFFDLTVDQDITITSMGVHTLDNGSVVGLPVLTGEVAEVEVWARLPSPSTWNGFAAVGTGGALTHPPVPPGWTSLGVLQITVAAPGTPSFGTFATPIVLPAGTYGVALNYLFVIAGEPDAGMPIHPQYTDPATVPMPTTVSDQFVTMVSGRTQGLAWTGAVTGSVRIPNVTFDYLILPNSAHTTPYGTGCYNRKRSFYESFAAPGAPAIATIDLTQAGSAGARNGLDFLHAGDHYVVTNNAAQGLFVPPGSTPGAVHVNQNPPALSGSTQQPWDDALSGPIAIPFAFDYPGDGGAGTTVIDVSSNGIVYFQTATSTFGFYDNYPGFLANQPGIAGGWSDLDPADLHTLLGGQGDIWVDFDPLNQWVAVTWDGVREWRNAINPNVNLNTIQVVLNNGGDVNIRYGAIAFSEAPVLVGFTAGNGAPDPGTGSTPRQAPDLSVAAAGLGYLSGNGAAPASIGLTNRPGVGRPLTIRTDDVGPSLAVGANLTVVSAGSLPGLPLDLVQMPGCSAWVNLPAVASLFQVGPGPFSWQALTSIPAAFQGVDLYAQSVQFSTSIPPFNAVNLLTSDAICIHFDLN